MTKGRSIFRWAAVAAGLLLALFAVRPCSAADPARLTFAELYKSFGVLGLKFSDKVLALNGKTVALRGYMAPPLKPEADFFVLTKEPVSLCPFCQSDADWPQDIVVVYVRKGTPLLSNAEPLDVSGTVEVGSKTDPRTGFVSQLRLVDARLKRL